jgi:NAD(P)H-hydrate epimerase
MEMKLREVMTEPLPETPKQTLSLRAFHAIVRLCEDKRAMILGPGMGTDKETQSLILKLIKTVNLPIIVDADGLTALASQPKTLPAANKSLVLTPQPGEMARLLRSTVKEVQGDRIKISTTFSHASQVHLVLKGNRTLIATPKGDIFINSTGDLGMTSGGSGDVLSGMIGGLICQGWDLPSSLQMAVSLHGWAGEIAAREMAARSLMATDILPKLPTLLQRMI